MFEFSLIFVRNKKITHYSSIETMNNAIIATVFIAMMFAMGISTAYVFTPSPAVIYKTTEGESITDGLLNDVGTRRGR